MIIFDNVPNEEPYNYLKELYDVADLKLQENIEAASIATISKGMKPTSRFINIKYINDSFIFFSNYSSQKAKDLSNNQNVSLLFFWNKTVTQIRIEGVIKKSSKLFSDEHFFKRTYEKNIAAIISNQSSKIQSHEDFLEKYDRAYHQYKDKELIRPDSWGGYEIKPESFEFWHGSNFRLNKRLKYIKVGDSWDHYYLEP